MMLSRYDASGELFAGQYYDNETGLHYNRHRYYSPELGRYITSDPVGLAGGINTYAFVLGNPIILGDPLGLNAGTMTYGGNSGVNYSSSSSSSSGAGSAVASTAGRFVLGRAGWFMKPSTLGDATLYNPQQWQEIDAAYRVDAYGEIIYTDADYERMQQLQDIFDELSDEAGDGVCPLAGTPSGDPDCDKLNKEVQDAKKDVGRFGKGKAGCKEGMSVYELAIRKNAWLRLARARAISGERCWHGGDEGHQLQQSDAWDHVGKCDRLMRQ